MGGFSTGLSGLNAQAKNLDVIGNNVANATTVGFKASQAQFADVFAASLTGSGANQIGIGVSLAAVAQQFTQGNISVSNAPTDVAINGRGFFRLDTNGAITYTRNGQFQLDKEGYIVTNNGLTRLTGYQVDSTGAITGAMGALRLDTADISPKMTSLASPVVNLDSRSTVPTGAAFPATLTAVVPATTPPTYQQPTADMYNWATSTTIYDSLGNAHVAQMYFRKDAAAGTWNVYGIIDGGTYNSGAVLTFDQLVFDTSGQLTAPAGPPIGQGAAQTIGWDASLGVDVAQTLTLNFNSSTQFGSPFGVNSLTQDGYGAGRLSGFGIGKDGIVQGRYTNGQTKNMGQVALANFANPQGLQQLGNNQWAESPSSGQALVGAPGSANLGVLQSGAVEDSNVDMTAELVNMIVAQRAYQANAQTIKTQDAMYQTLVNLR